MVSGKIRTPNVWACHCLGKGILAAFS